MAKIGLSLLKKMRENKALYEGESKTMQTVYQSQIEAEHARREQHTQRVETITKQEQEAMHQNQMMFMEQFSQMLQASLTV